MVSASEFFGSWRQLVATAVAWHETTEELDSGLQETAERLLPLVLETIERSSMQVSSPAGEIGYQALGCEEYLLYQVRTSKGGDAVAVS